ncbi:DEAD/DEAH box helicase [Candidatus Albibeggiatoa sp. nov. NOAA]|uniref:DEAD/DEAH box helicase n=1 Tax=Candidatus Albibeggiatoa sp. nov. NOAA TaxID=3162724 RepID=UPI0032F6BE50|nr:DEAD/DEAH box helicase [Thiotrichaceae bacterium]
MSATITDFSQLALSQPVLQAVKDVGYEEPSPIQIAAIPPLLEKRDLIGQAQTGTGKTAAFALPLLSHIELGNRYPQVLVLTPTRELAIQVAEAFQRYARHMPDFHVLPIYGGQSMHQQLQPLRRGVHVVVGTPGRIADHLRRKSLDLTNLTTLVLDEADEMLRMGFIEEVEWIMEQAPSDYQTALFSATMPTAVRKVADKYLDNPAEIKIKTKTSTVSAIQQRYWLVSGVHKLDALTRMLEVEQFDAIIIFVRTKSATEELAEKLEARGYAASALNGDMNQAVREKTVDKLKKGDIDIIIATDVAARGLDVPRISHVINYDVPYDTETYVHRIGRTGRAGRKGEAILFVAPREKRMLRLIEQATRQPIEPMGLPSHAEVSGRRIARFKEQINDVLTTEDLDFFRQLLDAFQHEDEMELTDIAAALAYLAQRERPLQMPKSAKEYSPLDRDENHIDWVTYRLAVGRKDGVEPKNIVGAIANEADIESRYIGQIQFYATYTTVKLPLGMSKDTLQHLKKVRVCGKTLDIVEIEDDGSSDDRPKRRSRKGGGGNSRGRGRGGNHSGGGKKREGGNKNRKQNKRHFKGK